jgi:hypothetical protein
LSAELAQLRSEIAAERGLSAESVSFLTGVTLEEVEAQADRLVKVVGTTDAQPEREPAADLFSTARAAKAERQQALLAVVAGRSEQPRDPAGRYAGRGFDGGHVSPCLLPATQAVSTQSWCSGSLPRPS